MRQQPPSNMSGYASPNDPFLKRLDMAERSDAESHRSIPQRAQRPPPQPQPPAAAVRSDEGAITVDNWAQRSKKMAQLHIQNEIAELSYKEKMGMLPGQSGPPPPPPAQPPQRGPPMQQQMPQQRQQHQMQQRGMPQQMPQQRGMMQQQGYGGGMVPPGQQQPMQRIGGQGFDASDNRVPNALRNGKVMNAQQAQAARRGQGSSIVFG